MCLGRVSDVCRECLECRLRDRGKDRLVPRERRASSPTVKVSVLHALLAPTAPHLRTSPTSRGTPAALRVSRSRR